MYQFIMEVSLPERLHSAIIREREAHPSDSYFLANALPDLKIGNTPDDPMTLPGLAARLRTSFVANVFRGHSSPGAIRSLAVGRRAACVLLIFQSASSASCISGRFQRR